MQIRIAPSLGDLEGHPNEIWGTETYIPESGIALNLPTLFFGLYGLKDFFALWAHKGERHILWAGSDIRHFIAGYWLDETGKIRIAPEQLAPWLKENCTHWVENGVEYTALAKFGIKANVVPSFLGRVEDFPLYFVKQDKVRLYTSVSGNDFELYGWDKIPAMAEANPDIEFHLYGDNSNAKDGPIFVPVPGERLGNIFNHGRVPKEQMNEEIKNMTGALRLTQFDGFSEILAKSVLMGQWPVSLIPYPHMLQIHELKTLRYKDGPNIEGREHYLKVLNQYPWNLKK